MDDLIVEREFSKDAAMYLCRKAMEYFVPGVEDYMEMSELLLGCAEDVAEKKLQDDKAAAERCKRYVRDARKLLGMWTEKQLHDPAAAINAAEILTEMARVGQDGEQYRRAARFLLESEVLDGKRLGEFIEQCEELLREEPDDTQADAQDDTQTNGQDDAQTDGQNDAQTDGQDDEEPNEQDKINSDEETEQ